MSPCTPCRDLRGRLSADPPHAQLEPLRTGRGGRARDGSGGIDTYRCWRCLSLLHRDMDAGDARASWQLDVVGR